MTSAAEVTIHQIVRQHEGIRYALATPARQLDLQHRAAAEDGAWTAVNDCLLALISPGDTVLDIGANIGTVTMPLAAKGASVIAYEPLPENADLLEASVAANRFGDRVTVRRAAAWDKAGRLGFAMGSAWAHVAEEGPASQDAVTIDADLPPGCSVKAVKIDVEGSELHVLRGMRDLIARQRPHIVFESNSLQLGRMGSSAAMIFKFLRERNYRIYRLCGGRLLRTESPLQEAVVVDFLATRWPAWLLRWRTGLRVGRLHGRHLVRQILARGEDEWQNHLHVLAVADRLPGEVVGHPEVARLIAEWRRRDGSHPLLETMRRGTFGDGDGSKPDQA